MTASRCLLYLAGVSLEGGRGAWSLFKPDCGLEPLRNCRPVDVCESGAVLVEGAEGASCLGGAQRGGDSSSNGSREPAGAYRAVTVICPSHTLTQPVTLITHGLN